MFTDVDISKWDATNWIKGIEAKTHWIEVDVVGIGVIYYPLGLPMEGVYDTISCLLWEESTHKYEIPEASVREGDVVIDAGAAEGLFSLMVADRASSVFAFEPAPVLKDCLLATIGEYNNVHFSHTALSSYRTRSGSLEGYGERCELGGSEENKTPIMVDTIDHVFGLKRVNFIKADVEGSELALLKGAKSTLQIWGPRLAICLYHKPEDREEIPAYLTSLGVGYVFKDSVDVLHAWVE